jgi:hypothetical protein
MQLTMGFVLICSGLSHFISSAARTYATNAQNQVVTSLPGRLCRWVRWKLGERLEFLKGTQVNLIAQHILSSCSDPANGSQFAMPPAVVTELGSGRLSVATEQTRLLLSEVQQLLGGMSISDDDMAKSWWKYLPVSLLFDVITLIHRIGS